MAVVKIRVGGVQQEKKVKKATCHPDKPLQARGLCKNCYDSWLKARNPDYAARQKQNNKAWRERYQDKAKASHERWIAKKDAKYLSARGMMTRFGMTPDDYDTLAAKHDGGCWICGRTQKRRLAIDHSHETGEIRGLLCFRCNFGLSYFSESLTTLERAVEYLKEGPQVHVDIDARISERLQHIKVSKTCKMRNINSIVKGDSK